MAPPVVLTLSLTNAKDYIFAAQREFYDSNRIDRPHVFLPPVVMNTYTEPIATVLRPTFDALWNAGGLAACNLYTANGTLPSG